MDANRHDVEYNPKITKILNRTTLISHLNTVLICKILMSDEKWIAIMVENKKITLSDTTIIINLSAVQFYKYWLIIFGNYFRIFIF